ncbi:hypothetical protein KY349_02580 [Candidatus Woesearchaeota archaeon]|nr:hypothetical protein [Candidatus Woesearchaeota archaeon]
MPKSLRHRLLEKGWSEQEIEKTMSLMYSEDKRTKQAGFVKATHPIIYWVGLVVAIIGNLLLAVTLIPFLMILNSIQLYIILGIVGFVFGGLFNVILKDIEQVDQTHHVVAGIFIPAIALITVYIMTTVANRFNEVINNPNPHNAIILSIIYLVCFSAPYFIYKIKDLVWHKKQKAPPAAA